MIDRVTLESLFLDCGFSDYRWMDPHDIVVAQWVRMKCMFGCGHYGRNASCPPNVPTVAECRQFFSDYTSAAVFHFQKTVDNPEDRHEWSRSVNQKLLALEKTVFLSGFQKAFLLFMDSCGLCKECSGQRAGCSRPRESRPTPEALGIDVYSTVRRIGYPIEVLSAYGQAMNRYAFLLIE